MPYAGLMIRYLRMLIPAGLLAVAIYFLIQSYEALIRWHIHLSLNDPSGAELYELNFWLNAPTAIVLVLLGGFLAGRWWKKP